MNRYITMISMLLLTMLTISGCNNVPTTMSEFDGKELFTYIDENNNLIVESTDSEVKKTILTVKENEQMIDYDISWKEQKIAYIIQYNEQTSDEIEDTGEFYTELRLFNLKDDTEKVLHRDDWIIRGIKWSPDGENILMDIGTGVIGSVSLYNLATNDWMKIQDGVYSYSWSPNGKQLALSVRQVVNPPTPVEDGSSFTTIVLNLQKENTIQTIMAGTSNFFVSPITWGDNNTLYIAKWIFGEDQPVYYKTNVTDNNLTEVAEADIPNQYDDSNYPDEVRDVLHQVSPDGKKVLYVKYIEAAEKLKVMLWDTTKEITQEYGYGEMPKWIK